VNLRDLTGSYQRADSRETPVTRREVQVQPQIAEQHVGSVLHDSRGHFAELLSDA
jgi:hypothetical protein